MAQNDGECRARNGKSQNDRLFNIVAAARNSNKINNDILSIGKRLLLLNAMAHKLQTEKEKLLPFGRSHGQSQSVAIDADNEQIDNELNRDPMATTTDSMAGGVVHDIGDIDGVHDGHPELANFVHKYNAVLLDTTCFQQKRKALAEDNKKLRAVLKAYLDGIIVSNHTVSERNTLFVLKHSTALRFHSGNSLT